MENVYKQYPRNDPKETYGDIYHRGLKSGYQDEQMLTSLLGEVA
jgi:hypothetical protein